jgi:putative transport protein
MNWLTQLASTNPIAHAVLALAFVAALGLGLGSLRLRGVGLGVAGVLFAGIGLGHFGLAIDHMVQDFVREFGLVLFVYTIGMQVGPGFFTSLRRHGLVLNSLAAAVVFLGAALALLLGHLGKFDIALTTGIFSGATTNTPSLGATMEALKSAGVIDPARQALPGIGYAVSYPFGIVGIIIAMLGLRTFFKATVTHEAEEFHREEKADHEPLERRNLYVANFDGIVAGQLPGLTALAVTISRVRHHGDAEVRPVLAQTRLQRGDIVLAVGPRAGLDAFELMAGEKAPEDLMEAKGRVTWRRVHVTAKGVLGKSLRELALDHYQGVTVTRVRRAGVELPATPDLRLNFGDNVQIVGQPASMPEALRVLGDSVQELGHTNFGALFIGLALGVIVGVFPFHFEGIPAPIRLGLAGGPLLVAIVLSRLGRIGRIIFHMPHEANLAFRELGIALFLACVGLKAGARFFEVLLHGDGLLWMAAGAVITLVPLLVVGAAARACLKLNFMRLFGLLAGSMTDPPALAFANTIARSDAPSVAYATVYPMTMLLRIIVAQILVLM